MAVGVGEPVGGAGDGVNEGVSVGGKVARKVLVAPGVGVIPSRVLVAVTFKVAVGLGLAVAELITVGSTTVGSLSSSLFCEQAANNTAKSSPISFFCI